MNEYLTYERRSIEVIWIIYETNYVDEYRQNESYKGFQMSVIMNICEANSVDEYQQNEIYHDLTNKY